MIKKIMKRNSPYFLGLTLIECLISIVCTIAFVYSDTLSYADSTVFEAIGLEKLLENIYSSTWWSLILLLFAFIAILNIATLYLKKMDYAFISMLLWGELLILAINLNKPLFDNLTVMALFIPILIINIIAYKDQAKKVHKK